MIAALLTAAIVALAALPGTPPAPDDPLPLALDALLTAPEDEFFFGVPDLADGAVLAAAQMPGFARCAAAAGDVNGDGWTEFALGLAPGSAQRTLELRDGHSGALLWQAAPGGGGFRTLAGLAARDGWLAAGVTSALGRVECRSAATGTLRWSRDLAPAAPSGGANVLALTWVPDVNADGQADLVAGAGRGIDAVVALSGSSGRVLWRRGMPGCVAAVAEAGDLDGDGIADVFATGGDATPFAAALSGADGQILWSVAVPSPGSALLPLGDLDRDGAADLAVGLVRESAPCLVALSGDSGALLWTALDSHFTVTALVPVSDLDGDGLPDIGIGSFENAGWIAGSASGVGQWRREGTTNNTGAMLGMASVGDLDGNGSIDLAAASVDHQLYLFDGEKGHPLAIQDLRVRGVAVATLPDGSGDGRSEFVAAGEGKLLVLGGHSGTVLGPVVLINAPASLGSESTLHVYAYPQKLLVVMGSLGTGALALPGYTGELGLDLATLGLLHLGTAPAAGGSGYLVHGFPAAMAGMTIYYQAATVFEPGHGLIGAVVSVVLPAH